VAASGSHPVAARTLSSAWWGLVVPGMAHVTAGWLTTYLRKNRPHVSAHLGRPIRHVHPLDRVEQARPPERQEKVAATELQ